MAEIKINLFEDFETFNSGKTTEIKITLFEDSETFNSENH